MNRDNLRERGISLLVSFLFHAAFLFFLIKLDPPVKFYLFRHVAEVRIVEPGIISYPRIAELPDPPSSGSHSPGASSGHFAEQVAEVPQLVEPTPGVIYLKNLSLGMPDEQTAEIFDLVPAPKREGKFSLNISPKESSSAKKEEAKTGMDLGFRPSQPLALSNLPFNRIITDKKGVMSSRRMDVAAYLEEFALAPWVKEVVDKIRNSWRPPPIEESIAIGEVKILLIVGKEGNLIDLKILEPSDFPIFDQTATAAIRSSAPFLPLPPDFPDQQLEAHLIFEFHE
jgi:TonB family protein